MRCIFLEEILSQEEIDLDEVDSNGLQEDFHEKRTWLIDGVHTHKNETFSPVAEVGYIIDGKEKPAVVKITETYADCIKEIRKNDTITHVNKQPVYEYSSVSELTKSMDMRVNNTTDVNSPVLEKEIDLTLVRENGRSGYEQVELRLRASWEEHIFVKCEARKLTCSPTSGNRKIVIKKPLSTNKPETVVLSTDMHQGQYLTIKDRELTARNITDDSEMSDFAIHLHNMTIIYVTNKQKNKFGMCCAIEIQEHWIQIEKREGNKVKLVLIKKKEGESVDTWPKDDLRIFKQTKKAGVNGDRASFESLPIKNFFLTCVDTHTIGAEKPGRQGSISRCNSIDGEQIPVEAWFNVAPANLSDTENTTPNDSTGGEEVNVTYLLITEEDDEVREKIKTADVISNKSSTGILSFIFGLCRGKR